MALPPRDYQAVVGDLVLRSGALLCADEVGLGKTIEALTMLSDSRALPGLVATMPHLQKQWKDEIERFLPGLRVHILKKGTPYDLTRRRRQKVPVPRRHLVELPQAHWLGGDARREVQLRHLRRDAGAPADDQPEVQAPRSTSRARSSSSSGSPRRPSTTTATRSIRC
jgi:hypothetical protein